MAEERENKRSNKLLWTLVTIAIAALTIFTVSRSGGGISPKELFAVLGGASPAWLAVSVLSMLGYISFEALALHIILQSMGYRLSWPRSLLYSAGDIYFSAITPSATGGQPASAFFMASHGISAVAITVTLLWNVTMLTFATFAIGVFCLLSNISIFLHYSMVGKLLIIFGLVALAFLAGLFILLLKRSDFLLAIARSLLGFLHRIHLIRRPERLMERLERMKEEYRLCESSLSGKGSVLFWVFVFNLLQRIAQISVTLFVHFAISGTHTGVGFDLWVAQAYAQVGSNCFPVPGGMGAIDYLMIDGFDFLLGREYAFQLQLISRSLSFYLCVALSGIVVLVTYLVFRRRKRKELV